MDSTFYFYYGIYQQWLLFNGSSPSPTTEEAKVKNVTLDEIPESFWN